MSDIIIIESPNKVKKIRSFLPGSPKIIPTVGHFKDLPEKGFGFDPITIEPTFVYNAGKQSVGDDIRRAAKGNRVFIATDPDREGYAIGMHAYEEAKGGATEILRVEIREITQKGVSDAFAKAVPFLKTNWQLYDAFLGRRIADRVVGYTLSPRAMNALKGRYSVGRVQSPAVRLVVDRELEIRAFKPVPYWVAHVLLEKDRVQFKAFHADGNIKEQSLADEILRKVTDASTALTESVEQKETRQSPRPPFTTVEMQAAASSRLRIQPERAMRLAQDLFEAGLISYHRTDSVRIADDSREEIRGHVFKAYGKEYLSPFAKQYKSKSSQAEAHEAIRPTHVHGLADCGKVVLAEEKMTQDHVRLYELICRRCVASQMADAVFDSVTAVFDVAGEKFKSTGKTLKFQGFLKAYEDSADERASEKEADSAAAKVGAAKSAAPGGKSEAEEATPDQKLPPLSSGELLPKIGQGVERKETKPPRRYSEAGLIKALEKLGIGRPSTYAAIVKLIKGKGYVKVDKAVLIPTTLGERLIAYLMETCGWVIDYDMTRKMEERLDEVEERKADWKCLIREIVERLGGLAAPSPSHTAPFKGRELSEKQLAIVNRYGTAAIKGAVASGDFAAGRAFVNDHMSRFKKSPGTIAKPKQKTGSRRPKAGKAGATPSANPINRGERKMK